MSTTSPTRRSTRVWLRRAWLSVALVPVFFVLADAVGFGLYKATSSPRENIAGPLWLDLLGAAATTALFWIPCAAAVVYGRRSSRGGDRRGQVPVVIGALAGLGYTVVNLVVTLAA